MTKKFKFSNDCSEHQHCIEKALRNATELCNNKGLRLTSTRRRVLELVWHGHAPIGAYSILNTLSKVGSSVAPPTVYRALHFLETNGLIHRIESLNAYIGCPNPSAPHESQFLICETCGTTHEMRNLKIAHLINEGAHQHGFSSYQQMIEIRGICINCSKHLPSQKKELHCD